MNEKIIIISSFYLALFFQCVVPQQVCLSSGYKIKEVDAGLYRNDGIVRDYYVEGLYTGVPIIRVFSFSSIDHLPVDKQVERWYKRARITFFNTINTYDTNFFRNDLNRIYSYKNEALKTLGSVVLSHLESDYSDFLSTIEDGYKPFLIKMIKKNLKQNYLIAEQISTADTLVGAYQKLRLAHISK